ncbi:MAG: VOC family protein [Pseudomonadota bacterium]|nr:VOC family protein [Pseudomonadota bacterium]
MQKITPFLWFDNQAEAAVDFYVSVFPRSSIRKVVRYMKGSPGPEGSVMTIDFVLDGVDYVALNGGPVFTFSSATSFVINCTTQQEVDHYWEKLGAGGRYQQCGWVVDKFGVTWQVVPVQLVELMTSLDAGQNERVMQAMLKMDKLDIATLERAAAA